MPVESFNPMDIERPGDEGLWWANQQSQVRSVIDSYHGKLDGLVEAIQNSVDAIEKRWTEWTREDEEIEALDSVPRLRIELNFDENSISILDNGSGIAVDELPRLLRPFMGDKRQANARGHKGVGTTLLAYGHRKFEIHTKTHGMENAIGYAIEDGRAWALADEALEPPVFRILEEPHPSLEPFASGTFAKIYLDANTSTQRLRSVLHNTPKMWATVLRGSSAIGYVSLSTTRDAMPDWVKNLNVMLTHRDGVEQVEFKFPLPHTFSINNEVVCKDLQWLQNNPGVNREFSLIYCERNHAQLRDLLRDKLTELENDNQEEFLAIMNAFNDFEVEVYASLAYKNTFYEEQFRTEIELPNARRLSLPFSVDGGVVLSSVNMPMADLQKHTDAKIQPQLRRRYFLLLHLNKKFSPDIGRKTIPQALGSLVSWLEKAMLGLLRTQEGRLLRDREQQTRPAGGNLRMASEELRKLGQTVVAMEGADDETDMSDMVIARTPRYEEEVVALFIDLLVRNILKGYVVRALPGNSSRYDCFFDYSISEEDAVSDDVIGLHQDQLVNGPLSFTAVWLEFKRDVDGLVSNLESEDGDPSKKYFSQISVAVVWEANQTNSDNFELVEIEKRQRQFFGATHVLQAENNDHVIEIIELRTVIENWLESQA